MKKNARKRDAEETIAKEAVAKVMEPMAKKKKKSQLSLERGRRDSQESRGSPENQGSQKEKAKDVARAEDSAAVTVKVVAEEDREEAVEAVDVEMVLKMDKGRRREMVDKSQATTHGKERRELMAVLKRDNQTGIPDQHAQKLEISCKRRNTSQETLRLPENQENPEMVAMARQEEEADVDAAVAVVAEVIEVVAEAAMVLPVTLPTRQSKPKIDNSEDPPFPHWS